jgi:hypothetical protein
MQLLTRTVHVLAMGLWFGSCAFFMVVAFSLFHGFEAVAENHAHRPAWFPLPEGLRSEGEAPEGLYKEQGTRAAGFAIAPLFDFYFAIQSIAGAAALVTALTWARLTSKVPVVHKVRVVVLLVAVVGVAVGWWLEQQVSLLGVTRNRASDAVLEKKADANPEEWAKARAEFGRMHGWSMTLNLVTTLAVTAGMALTAFLPPIEPAPPDRQKT